MAGTSLFALIDDIATLLDDVALLTKVAGQKTAGVVGDDLALNAQQVTGIAAERELPVVWAVGKGSMLNKAILVPAALAISAATPWLVTPLLMCGGAFLCFEGVEKVAHKVFHPKEEHDEHTAHLKAVADENIDLVAFEKEKVKGAVRTDFVLSAEILAIALGEVAVAPFLTQVVVLVVVSVVMTVGVYGLVGVIVKLDDVALCLSRLPSAVAKLVGRGLLGVVPWLMKSLAVLGTVAVFLVGGGIFVHGVPALHHFIQHAAASTGGAAPVVTQLGSIVVGLLLGCVLVGIMTVFQRLRRARAAD
jgi:predicted DNA repair protein MutK